MLLQAMPYPAQVGGVITFVGSHTTALTGAGGTVNYSSLLNSAGATPTLLEGDIVVAVVGRLNQSSFPMTASDLYPSGFTSIRTDFTSGSNAGGGISRKIMGATPDTSLSISDTGSGGAFGATSVTIHVFRGIDPTMPIDASVVAATSTSGPPDAPSVTPAVTGAIVFASGFATTTDNAVVTAFSRPANLDSSTNAFRSARSNAGGGSIQACTGAGFSSWTSGAFDPNAFGGNALWGAGRGYTLSFRPYGPPEFTPTITDTVPLAIAVSGSAIGSITAYSWKLDGVEESTSATYTPSGAGTVTCDVTMTNGPYSATETATATYNVGNLLIQSGGDAILQSSGGDNILIREVL